MENMTESVGEQTIAKTATSPVGEEIYGSVRRLFGWLERNDYQGYDTFDGLSSRLLRPLTFDNKLLLTVLQQGIRRFPLNLRPLVGIDRGHSTKAMGFLARGFLRLHQATSDPIWAEKSEFCLQWLIDNQLPGYSGACWGNHFDYHARHGSIPKGMPTVVWTSLIGHAFLDGYQYFGKGEYLSVAVSICEHILHDLRVCPDGEGVCINYTPGTDAWVHNANTLGGCFLARTYSHTKSESYRALAQKAMQYTAQYQRANGSWFYAEKPNNHWVDSFHTGYVLDCFKHYFESTGDHRFDQILQNGYEFWKKTFLLSDGTPRYYDYKTLPLDIQCSSQAIDTLVFFSDRDPEAVPLAIKVAQWAITNMQDKSGYFYYRRYGKWLVNKTPTLHWGQATMFCAFGGLYKELIDRERQL